MCRLKFFRVNPSANNFPNFEISLSPKQSKHYYRMESIFRIGFFQKNGLKIINTNKPKPSDLTVNRQVLRSHLKSVHIQQSYHSNSGLPWGSEIQTSYTRIIWIMHILSLDFEWLTIGKLDFIVWILNGKSEMESDHLKIPSFYKLPVVN